MKILILKPSSLGDVVQAIPVARLIRRHHPGARIDWFLNRELCPLLDGDPDLHRLIPFDRRGWARPTGWPEAVGTIRNLRRTRYDWVIDLQSLARTAAIAWLARGSLTIGLEDTREGAPLFHDRSVPRPSARTHAVDWYLSLVRELGIPTDGAFEWLPRRAAVAATVQARWPSEGGPWIGLQPGARWENKRWPAARFAAVAGKVRDAIPSARFAVLGGSGDRALGDAIVAAAPGVPMENLCGRLDLPEVVEWLRRSACLVTNDTGPMHLAAALGIPVVGLFGPTSPDRTGPYGQVDDALRGTAPCAPCLRPRCHHSEPLACLESLTADRVAREVRRRLNRFLAATAHPSTVPSCVPSC